MAGDRVAGFLPNIPEAVIAMLATTSLGAVWSSCSPDFGVHGVLDRFGQIAPKVLFTADGYFYAGKSIDSLAAVSEVLAKIPSIQRVVVIPYVNAAAGSRTPRRSAARRQTLFDAFGKRGIRAAVCADALQSSAVHSVFVGHHWRAQSASCTAPAARCSSIRRSICSTRT